MGIIVPFIVEGVYGDYLKARGAKQIPNVGTWIPSRCRHLMINLTDDKPYAKHLENYCEIYAYRPKLCHVDEPVAGFAQWSPQGCSQNEV
jgi:hypothetical protein